MKFDLTAAKAYVGGILAVAAVPVSTFIGGLFHAGLGMDLPSWAATALTTGLAYVFGHVGVYLTPNKAA